MDSPEEEAPKKSVEQLQARKELLLKEYLKLQDEIEALNTREYDLTCAIRALDLELKRAIEERARTAVTKPSVRR